MTVPTARTTTVEVRLPSRLGFEKVAMSTASAVAKLMGFREERIDDLKTAVAEACINAIEHGNRHAACRHPQDCDRHRQPGRPVDHQGR